MASSAAVGELRSFLHAMGAQQEGECYTQPQAETLVDLENLVRAAMATAFDETVTLLPMVF